MHFRIITLKGNKMSKSNSKKAVAKIEQRLYSRRQRQQRRQSASKTAKKAVAKSAKKAVAKKVSTKAAKKPNALHAKIFALMTRKDGATIAELVKAGFYGSAMAALKIAERRGMKVRVAKPAGEFKHYIASAR